MSSKHVRNPFPLWPAGGTAGANGNTAIGFQSDVPGISGRPVRQGIARMDGLILSSRSENEDTGPVSGGGQRSSGSGCTDGNPFGDAGGGADHQGPRFDLRVPPNGYGWWYADAISDDGRYGFSIIAMIGSVFSPYYAWSGRKDPNNHVALNVGLYGKGVKRWTMTERGRNDLEQKADYVRFGPSDLTWDGSELVVRVDEWANPIFRKVTGEIRITPETFTASPFQLDGKCRHFWQPLAPRARVKVRFDKPDLDWEGTAYVDSNWGSEPLEEGFINWDWSRAHLKDGTGVLYDAFTREGENRQLALEISKDGSVRQVQAPSRAQLKRGPIWRVPRSTLCSDAAAPKTLKMLEDTPFYTRSHIQTMFGNEEVVAVHESLDCDKFASTWVRCLLPFRMPRIAS